MYSTSHEGLFRFVGQGMVVKQWKCDIKNPILYIH